MRTSSQREENPIKKASISWKENKLQFAAFVENPGVDPRFDKQLQLSFTTTTTKRQNLVVFLEPKSRPILHSDAGLPLRSNRQRSQISISSPPVVRLEQSRDEPVQIHPPRGAGRCSGQTPPIKLTRFSPQHRRQRKRAAGAPSALHRALNQQPQLFQLNVYEAFTLF